MLEIFSNMWYSGLIRPKTSQPSPRSTLYNIQFMSPIGWVKLSWKEEKFFIPWRIIKIKTLLNKLVFIGYVWYNKDLKYFYNLRLLLYGPQNTLQFHSFFNAIHFMHILFIEHIVFSRQTDIFKQNKEIRGKRRQLNCQPI